MAFAYYQGLSKAQKAIYQKSNAITEVVLPYPEKLSDQVFMLKVALSDADQKKVQRACRLLSDGILAQLSVTKLRVKILLNRPHDQYGELQGLYESADQTSSALITLWMRTAKRRQVVAFKTFLRTILHEICHHLDYEYFNLDDSFHTEGFYQRETSLFKQLVSRDA